MIQTRNVARCKHPVNICVALNADMLNPGEICNIVEAVSAHRESKKVDPTPYSRAPLQAMGGANLRDAK